MHIVIIGGGAAGFFGALSAASHHPEARVTICEATQKPLDKVRISGGGRCNVTHDCFDPVELCQNYPRGAKELRGAFSRFQPHDTVEWFESHGTPLKTESDGRMFPISDDSATIVSCLRKTAHESGIDLRLGARVKSISVRRKDSSSNLFSVTLPDNAGINCDRILLATGSSPPGYRFAGELGHSIVPCVPSLFTFKIRDPRLLELAGISFGSVALTLSINDKKALKQSGPALITHWGLSGPAVLKLSAWGARELNGSNYRASLAVNFLPESSAQEIRNALDSRKRRQAKKRISGDNPYAIPNRYWKRIVEFCGIDSQTTWANISAGAVTAIINELTHAQFTIQGKGIFKEEFVTCGGVKLSEVDFKSMQSKLCDGLYFAGEILDIDGLTGGFNFQSAWTTGWIAGKAIGYDVA